MDGEVLDSMRSRLADAPAALDLTVETAQVITQVAKRRRA
jgi:hypothetical protein